MSIHIKKINGFNSFCGLNNIQSNEEFKGYNVFFANNGSGKTSITRALELLIQKNTHISKYQTINSEVSPSIDFELSDRNLIINSTNTLPTLPFKLEVYNSDFLQYNAPLNSEFGLKKLDDETIVLEGSAIGEETKEIEELTIKKIESEKRLLSIGNIRDIDNLDDTTEIKKRKIIIQKEDSNIEKVRRQVTSNSIQIKLEDFYIKEEELKNTSIFNYDEAMLVNLEKEFESLNNALKKFDILEEISIPSLIYKDRKSDLDWIFRFDIEKEAGDVSSKIKDHIEKVGRRFIEDGIKTVENKVCPFCTQSIDNDILDEYTNYFNESIKRFNSLSLELDENLDTEISKWISSKQEILKRFNNYEPFISEYIDFKEDLNIAIDNIIKELRKLKKLVSLKKGVDNKNSYEEKLNLLENSLKDINTLIKLSTKVLENKKSQQEKLKDKKKELRNLKIKKAKKDSFSYQKLKYDAQNEIDELVKEYIELEKNIGKFNSEINTLKNQRRPDIQQINIYFKALNLSKYSVNQDYKITLRESSVIENDSLRIVLSEGEKTTITFAYFLARLKLFYNKDSLKNLVIVIDDPISSLDEHRVYNTSYLVSKINQEIAGEILENTDDKAQVFVFTHSHLFMTNIIRILGKHTSYFQLERDNDCINIISKNKVAGYFDTFYLLLFKEVFEFAEKPTVIENFNEAINFGNKIRILLESFMKTNFVSKFIEQEYRNQSSFDTRKLKNITDKILSCNINHQFSNSYFKDCGLEINNESDLKLRLINIEKGLHMDSHGSIADYYNQYKLSLKEVQKLAKIVINIMTSLNPNQTYFYIEAVKNN